MVKQQDVLTGIFVRDKNHGSYTGFFRQVPEAVSQGETLEEAEENLFKILPMVMEVRNKLEEEEKLINGDDGDTSLIERSYNFQQ